jgi:uncharacterized protein
MNLTLKLYKYCGLFIALILPFIFLVIRHSEGPVTQSGLIKGEILFWALFIMLLALAKYGEGEPIDFSGNSMKLIKTIGLSVLVLLSLILAGMIYRLFYRFVLKSEPPHEELTQAMSKYPVWLKTMLVIRAGVIEETFFRAYAITRIKQLTNSNLLAYTIPLLVFAIGHFAYGNLNHIIGAFILGLVLTVYFVRSKNLPANIIGHSLYDALGFILH